MVVDLYLSLTPGPRYTIRLQAEWGSVILLSIAAIVLFSSSKCRGLVLQYADRNIRSLSNVPRVSINVDNAPETAAILCQILACIIDGAQLRGWRQSTMNCWIHLSQN